MFSTFLFQPAITMQHSENDGFSSMSKPIQENLHSTTILTSLELKKEKYKFVRVSYLSLNWKNDSQVTHITMDKLKQLLTTEIQISRYKVIIANLSPTTSKI